VADLTERLHLALHTLWWNAAPLGYLTGVDDRTCRRWLNGTQEPPESLVEWLERLAACHRANPPPPPPDASQG
jgi:hypothetical protein